MKNFTFHFFHHKIMKWPWLSPYFKSFSVFVLVTWQNYNILAFPIDKYYVTVWSLPGSRLRNFRFCHNCNSYSFHTRYCLKVNILNVLSIYVNDRKFVWKDVHRGHTYYVIIIFHIIFHPTALQNLCLIVKPGRLIKLS